MDPDLFFHLHDLGASEWQMQAVLNGAMPVEALLEQLENPAEALAPPPLPAVDPIHVDPPPPPPVQVAPLPVTFEPPPQRDDEVMVIPPPVEIKEDEVFTGPVMPANMPPLEDTNLVGKPVAEGEDEMANYGPPGWVWDGAKWVGGKMADAGGAILGGIVSTATQGFVASGPTREQLGVPGYSRRTRGRRRRRRLLTCSDKADIAYLVGQLGQGQLGKAAISALLSRRCG